MSEEIPEGSTKKSNSNAGVGIIVAIVILLGAVMVYNATQNDNKSKALAILSGLQNPAVSTDQQSGVTHNTDSMTDKSFHLDSVTFTSNSGMGGANARVTNMSNAVRTGIFNITVFASDNSTIASVLTGSAQDVQPGQTVTVQFFSFKDLPAQLGTYAFQVSMEN